MVPTAVTAPLRFDNRLEAQSWGVELESTWTPTSWMRLVAGGTWFDMDVDRVGSSDTLASDAGNDAPEYQLHLRGSFDLPYDVTVDAALYWFDKIKGEDVDGYLRGDLRLGWKPRDDLELAVIGRNLFDPSHPEYGDILNVPTQVPRSFLATVTWRR